MTLHWIKTSDRLPEPKQLVIVAIVNKAGVKMRDVGYYDHAAETWILGFDDVDGDERITHWMPLPEVPEETAPEATTGCPFDEAVDRAHLIDWYISSVPGTDPPVWTEEHIEELCNDFYLIPKPETEATSR